MHARPHRYRCTFLAFERHCGHLRWTVDTEADLAYARRVFGHFGHGWFGWREALEAVEAHPQWSEAAGAEVATATRAPVR
ncbi:MAG: hypothetical protein ACYTJ0_11420, partial [Planctomycetota bacterium]